MRGSTARQLTILALVDPDQLIPLISRPAT